MFRLTLNLKTLRRRDIEHWLIRNRPLFMLPVADIGSRKGRGLRLVSGSYTTIDIDPGTNPDVVADVQNLRVIAANVYGTVVCTETLQYIKNPEAAIGEIYRVLTSGGRLYLSCPFLFTEHLPQNDRHRYTEFRLRELLSAFEIEFLDTTGNLWAVAADALTYDLHRSTRAWKVVNLALIAVFRTLAKTRMFPQHHTGYLVIARKW